MEVKHRAFVERQSGHPMSLTLFYDEAFEGAGQGELPEGVLDRDLPDRYRAEEDFVCGIGKDPDRRGREFFRARNNPQERAGVEKTPHPCVPSNASMSSSGRGSKKERGTENVPFAKPIGRGRAGASGSRVICATG